LTENGKDRHRLLHICMAHTSTRLKFFGLKATQHNLLKVSIFKEITMPQNEVISLRETRRSDASEHQLYNNEEDASSLDQADSRRWESNRRRACVLVGSGLLQLPIWGRLSSIN
jgi:hypothetical protein